MIQLWIYFFGLAGSLTALIYYLLNIKKQVCQKLKNEVNVCRRHWLGNGCEFLLETVEEDSGKKFQDAN